jgi:hypothetical protein
MPIIVSNCYRRVKPHLPRGGATRCGQAFAPSGRRVIHMMCFFSSPVHQSRHLQASNFWSSWALHLSGPGVQLVSDDCRYLGSECWKRSYRNPSPSAIRESDQKRRARRGQTTRRRRIRTCFRREVGQRIDRLFFSRSCKLITEKIARPPKDGDERHRPSGLSPLPPGLSLYLTCSDAHFECARYQDAFGMPGAKSQSLSTEDCVTFGRLGLDCHRRLFVKYPRPSRNRNKGIHRAPTERSEGRSTMCRRDGCPPRGTSIDVDVKCEKALYRRSPFSSPRSTRSTLGCNQSSMRSPRCPRRSRYSFTRPSLSPTNEGASHATIGCFSFIQHPRYQRDHP